MIARRHHYLTQCYLKGFATERRKPRLFVIDIPSRKPFRTAPENIGAIRDFNRVDLPGIAPDQLEKDYAKFESNVGPALERTVEAAGFATRKDRELILHLLVLIAFRNPRLRAMRDRATAEISKRMIELTLET